ncbi:mannose-binding protein-like [Gopherus flavomarginatus]|uniref:mannose-binding protein-like n=1 Tax=Gopherus flavomarginatus TaxID=286002 RepID=UPI0021CBDFD2|nr:mannose-binding protein-like [Gopherus flavomarginatus]
MHLCQPFKALVLAMALMMASGVDINKHEENMNSCPVIQCCAPGTNGLPGRDGRDGKEGPKGEKGDQGARLRGLQGFPGKAGPQGTKGDQGPQGEKGQKGESATFDALQRQVTALEKNIQTLQADISRPQKYEIFFSFRWVKSVGKKTFMLTGTKDSFENGKSLFTKAGGALACPHNRAENTALQEILKDSEQAYLGMSDVQTEGKFLYLNGGPVTYTNWETGEPNNNKNEDSVSMYSNGKWNDIDCSNSEILIICEF